jgi:hypothetical protein
VDWDGGVGTLALGVVHLVSKVRVIGECAFPRF